MSEPRATYRLQFHKGFTFDQAIEIVPYLARLGISHLYSSPITQARPGSLHGYDIVDHSRINLELGGEEAFIRLSEMLKSHGLGLILDIVPNHMGVGGADNSYWLSVLEWGELSPFANMFDIDWGRLGAGGKLVVPFLGSRYGVALEAGELDLRFEPDEGSFSVWHWEHRFPVCPLDYPDILERAIAALGELHGGGSELLTVAESLRAMATESAPERRAAFPEEAEALKARLSAAAFKSADVKDAIGRAVALINGARGTPESFGALHRLLEAQNYRLAHWRVAASDINYRRFFDINSLGGIRVEEPDVFDRTHALIFRLIREGRVQGLRIDHIDGLADPEGYVHALQREIGPGFYILVEKILEPGEVLRKWPVAGTTGYDMLNVIDGVLVDMRNEKRFDRIYRDSSGIETGYGRQLRAAKEEIVETSFASELEVLVSDLKRIADTDWGTRDYTVIALRRALTEIITRLPVYRTYIGAGGETDASDRALLERTLRQAKRWSTLPDRSVHDFILAAIIGSVDTETPGRPVPEDVARFRRRFQQLTGPVMAKSLEDTLFYRYARLISLNEVGGDPDHFGITVAAFHAANTRRAADWPHAMTATATHDTKRGEDARARLHALSEMPDVWAHALEDWQNLVAAHLTELDGEPAPDANDRIMILQSLLGAWPLELLASDEAGAIDDFRIRIKAWSEKALREAKRYTSWVNENAEYEGATAALLDAILIPGGPFFQIFRPLAARLAICGTIAGLSRTVLKCTLPGVPDIYQGTELWDFSLVDPDNRRPVDYAARSGGLDPQADPTDLVRDWKSSRIKQYVLAQLLGDRLKSPPVYASGRYVPIALEGPHADDVVAFCRQSPDAELAVIVPRRVSRLEIGGDPSAIWADTRLSLAPGSWFSPLTRKSVDVGSEAMAVADLFAQLPVAVLRRERGEFAG